MVDNYRRKTGTLYHGTTCFFFIFYLLRVLSSPSLGTKKKKRNCLVSLLISRGHVTTSYQPKANDWTWKDYDWDWQEITFLKHHVNEFSTPALSGSLLMMQCDTVRETKCGNGWLRLDHTATNATHITKKEKIESEEVLPSPPPSPPPLYASVSFLLSAHSWSPRCKKNPTPTQGPALSIFEAIRPHLLSPRYDNRWALYLLSADQTWPSVWHGSPAHRAERQRCRLMTKVHASF